VVVSNPTGHTTNVRGVSGEWEGDGAVTELADRTSSVYLDQWRTAEVIALRSAKLATALLELPNPSRVTVLCCDRHGEDEIVGRIASELIGAEVDVIPSDAAPAELGARLHSSHATVLLACAEGTELWRSSGIPIVVLGEGEGVRWWRIAELRAAPFVANV